MAQQPAVSGGGVAVTTRTQIRAPLVITASLGMSIVVFTLLLEGDHRVDRHPAVGVGSGYRGWR